MRNFKDNQNLAKSGDFLGTNGFFGVGKLRGTAKFDGKKRARKSNLKTQAKINLTCANGALDTKNPNLNVSAAAQTVNLKNTSERLKPKKRTLNLDAYPAGFARYFNDEADLANGKDKFNAPLNLDSVCGERYGCFCGGTSNLSGHFSNFATRLNFSSNLNDNKAKFDGVGELKNTMPRAQKSGKFYESKFDPRAGEYKNSGGIWEANGRENNVSREQRNGDVSDAAAHREQKEFTNAEGFERLIKILDLQGYMERFNSFLARPKPLFMAGDSRLHYEKILELSQKQFEPPTPAQNLDDALMRLSKQATLHVSEIFEFAKIIGYFTYLKTLKFEGKLGEWLAKIEIPQPMLKLANSFDKNGELKDEVDERLGGIRDAFSAKRAQIDADLRRLIYSKSVAPYLVDTQVHYISSVEALLVRGGFNHVLKGTVVARSSGGYFYVAPENIQKLKKEQSELLDKKEQIVYEHCKIFSSAMHKGLLFLKFINGAFDVFDAYCARVFTAKSADLEFVLPSGGSNLKLANFAHPALKNPKSISIDFSKKVLLITGVNAGGKSMLLKSLIAAAFLAKYLLPMRINAQNSQIGNFKEFDAIIEDPQNVKNDISTFAGRMVHFSKLFTKKNLLIGVDEIELGTDFEEAASLYGVMIERLMGQDIKMIITTHHKRLAMLLAKNPDVELVAALYDEENSRPKFEFLKGTIGKSYAFETAARYGIAANLVAQAKKIYGEDKENLNEIITKTLNLEVQLKEKLESAEKKEQKLDSLIENLKEQKERAEAEQHEVITRLEREYFKAINEARRAINLDDTKEKQRALNRANEAKRAVQKPEISAPPELKVGDRVKYGKIKGVVASLSKNDAVIQTDNVSMRVPINQLKISGETPAPPKKSGINLSVQKPQNAGVTLDLHGLRADEAVQKLDKFISDSLVMGFDEVQVYHGIGTGKLAYAVKNFLREHPSVKEFFDAPAGQGGFGAQIVRL